MIHIKGRESCIQSLLPYGSQEGRGYLSLYRKTNEGNAWILQPAGEACLSSSGINKEQRIPDRSKTAHRMPLVKCFLTIPSILLNLSKKGLDQMSLVSINQPYRKAMVNNKYNYQDNHQSYSSRPDTVGNTLKPSSWV